MKNNILKPYPGIFLIVLIFTAFSFSDEKHQEITKNLDIFNTLFKEVNSYYVQDVDPYELIKVGIDAMLKSLDPYTSFISEEKIDDFYTLTTGEYYGIGLRLGEVNGKKVVLMPLKDFSAYKNGLNIGDEIIKINDIDIRYKSIDFVNDLLKSKDSPEIILKIKRYGQSKLIDKKLHQEKIKIKNVSYYGKLNKKTGYIKLNEFTYGASDEVRKALIELKSKGVEKLVLDLRNNPGGLLNEAIDVSNIFIEKGKEIVSTKGKVKEWNNSYRSLDPALDLNIPLVVLINNNSASAAEIVAGVMQDYDRAVLVGQNTYGKGLVQATRPISSNSKLKITTAKYYLPSGRCIQSIDYVRHKTNENSEEFYTLNGRQVLDGNGIFPDVKIKNKAHASVTLSLMSNGLIFDYATKYHYDNKCLKDAKNFHLDSLEFGDFIEWVKKKNFEFSTPLEKDLEELTVIAKSEGYYEKFSSNLEEMTRKIKSDKWNSLYKHKDEIIALLEEEIASRYFLYEGKIEASFNHDDEINKAVTILESIEHYKEILNI